MEAPLLAAGTLFEPSALTLNATTLDDNVLDNVLDNASHVIWSTAGPPSLGYAPGNSASLDSDYPGDGLVSWFPGRDSPYTAGQAVVIALVLLCVVIVTFVGNILVCVAVCLVRKLRRPCNYLLVSLAVSDICVAVLVMPMALLYEVFGRWDFGRVMCDLWVSFDVLSCTASILNLCMISVDRYYAITKPLEYGVKRTPRRMVGCVSLVWLMAACISLPPLLILGNEHEPPDGKGPPQCIVCQNFGYQIYATLWSFYIPLTVMIVVYYKIFRAARRIVLEERRAQTHLGPPHGYLQPPPATCCSYHHSNSNAAAAAPATATTGGGGGGGGAGVKNGGTSPDVVLGSSAASGASSLLLATPTGHLPAPGLTSGAATNTAGAGNVSPGSSPAASTPAASGRQQHRPSTTSTNTTCSGQLGSSRCLAASDHPGRRSDESQCPMLGPPARSRSPRGAGSNGNTKRSRASKKKKAAAAASSLGGSSPLKARHSSACSAATAAVGVSTHTRKLRFLAKERKASTTLGIIMSAFIICWLPFFVLALVRPFLRDSSAIPPSVTSLFLWLGYANSLLNPIIYATLNRDFRRPFQQILYFRCGSLNHMMREEFYQSQYGDPEPAQNYYHVAPQQYCVIGHVTPPSGAPAPRPDPSDDLGPSEDEAEDGPFFGSRQSSPATVITASQHLVGNADESFL